MDQSRIRSLISTVLELISYHIFPAIFILSHGLPNNSINFYLGGMVLMVALYKEFIRPLNPNYFFSGFYTLIYILLCVLGFKSMNYNIMILVFAQIVFLFVTRYFPERYNILKVVIDGFIVPSFISIAIVFYYAHFISINFVIPLLLVNITAMMISYFEGDISSYIQIIIIAIATTLLFFLGYINIYTMVAIIAFALIMVLLKIFNKFETTNLIYRFIGNLILII